MSYVSCSNDGGTDQKTGVLALQALQDGRPSERGVGSVAAGEGPPVPSGRTRPPPAPAGWGSDRD